MERKTHYSTYNVMHEEEHWDDHTREIVKKRLDIPGSFAKLTGEEVDLIKAVAALFVDDARSALLDYVVKHFDEKLSSNIGEAQRRPGVPPENVLIKEGLAALNLLAKSEHGQDFVALSPEKQIALLVGLEEDKLKLHRADGAPLPGKPFFKKMLAMSVGAYYSHPQVWSEIGYGGPAYPRGYVRSELGLTDPWEAKRDA